jgi:hypothetical protein
MPHRQSAVTFYRNSAVENLLAPQGTHSLWFTMNRIHPLIQFHNGVKFQCLQLTVPWHITQSDFLDLVPSDTITSSNSNWICGNFTLLGVEDNYAFNFIAFPDSLFHEVQVYDHDPSTLTTRFHRFAESIKRILGEPTMEFKTHVRWHDKFIVLNLSITDVQNTPDGPKFPCFMLSLQNSTRWVTHWNYQPTRRPGMEQCG